MTTILIVEDDLLIADMTEQILVDHSYEVCGIARTVDTAVALAHLHKPDLILLDLRLAGGGMGTEVAAQLDRIKRPGILYATGNISQFQLTSRDGHAYLLKPYRPADLIRGLAIVADLVATGTAPLPHPSGFQVLGQIADYNAAAT